MSSARGTADPAPVEESPPAPHARLARLDACLGALCLAGALAFVVAFLRVALARIGHPYELEWMEGGSVDHVRRLLAGEPLYVRPSVEFVPYIYTPLYFWVSALFAIPLGTDFLALRLVSLLSAVASFGLVHAIVARETESRGAGLLAAGLWAATFRVSGAWFDTARVDTLCVALSLAALLAIRFAEAPRGRVLAGVLLALAFLTKQTALALLPAAALHLLLTDRRGLAWFGGAFAVVAGGICAWLQIASDGWFAYYAFELPAGNPWGSPEEAAFWRGAILHPLPMVFAATAGTLVVLLARRDRRASLYAPATVLTLLAAWSARLHMGGYDNVFMPAHALLVVVAGIGLHGLHATLGRTRALSPLEAGGLRAMLRLALLWQLLHLRYDPAAQIPDEADRLAGDRVVERLRAVEGDVLVPVSGYLGARAGKCGWAPGLAYHVVLMQDERADRFRREVREAIGSGRFAAVALPWRSVISDWIEDAVERDYERGSRLVAADVEFFPRSGFGTRPEWLWTRADAPREARLEEPGGER